MNLDNLQSFRRMFPIYFYMFCRRDQLLLPELLSLLWTFITLVCSLGENHNFWLIIPNFLALNEMTEEVWVNCCWLDKVVR